MGFINSFLGASLATALSMFGGLLSSPNYTITNYGFGSGGVSSSSSSNYSIEGITGEASGQDSSSTNYSVNPGFIATEEANEPTISLSNPSNYYDKLQFIIGADNNSSNAVYVLQVSKSSTFASNVYYVQTDNTLSSTLSTADYQTLSAWGGSAGANIIGLSPNTTYYMRAAATTNKFAQSGATTGIYTQSDWGPISSAATVSQQLSYCVYTSSSCNGGGNSIAFSGTNGLSSQTISSSPNNIGINLSTNADSGANVYVYSANGGLKSVSAGYTITSATANLSSATSGYGAQVSSTSQTSGGPLSAKSPYNGSGNNVGQLSTNVSPILSSAGPLVSGVGSIKLEVLPSSTTPSATDYSDVLTLIAAANF